MKKIFFIIILLCIMAYAHADENTITSNSTTQINKKIELEYRKNFLYLRLTPLLIPGCAVGFTHRIRLKDETSIDFTLAAHYHFYREFQKSAGLSLIIEHFGNLKAKGIFYRTNIGVEYGEFGDPLGEEPDPQKRWMPNITGGLGYSIPVFISSSIRLSAEIGYTILFGKINCEFLF